MPVEVSWHIEKRVLLIRSIGTLTIEDMQKNNEAVAPMLDGLPEGSVFWLADNSKLEKVPAGLKALRESITIMKHPAIFWAITFGQKENVLIAFLSSALSQIMGIRYRGFATKAEAFQFMKEIDESLELEAS